MNQIVSARWFERVIIRLEARWDRTA